MRRLLISAATLLVALALGAPAGIGWLLHDRARPALAERLPDAAIDWRQGWFRSRIELASDTLSGRAELRHLPLSPPGWLALDARLMPAADSPLRAAAMRLRGRISLDGDMALVAESDELSIPGPVSWQYRGPRVEIHHGRDGGGRLHAGADWLMIHDRLGNQLAFTESSLEAHWTPRSERFTDLRLELALQRDGRDRSRLVLAAASVDREALGQLIAFGAQLGGAEPGSAAAGMAALGLAGAWQQLTQGRLRFDLETLSLDDRGNLTGRWQAGTGRAAPELSGALPLDATLEWSAQILGLGSALTPADARRTARELLDTLVGDGQVGIDAGRIVLPATSD